MQRALPLLIFAVVLTLGWSYWWLGQLEQRAGETAEVERPVDPGAILWRENLPAQKEMREAHHSPWAILAPGLPFPPPSTDDSLIWASEMEIHFPYLPTASWSLSIVDEATGFPVPHALVVIGPRGLKQWQESSFPEANLEGLLHHNGIAFRADGHGRLRILPEWTGLTVGARYGDLWGTARIQAPLDDLTIPLFIAPDRGILVRVQNQVGAHYGATVGMFVSSEGRTELVRQAATDPNGFAWLLHATDPGLRRPEPSTWWVDIVHQENPTPKLTYAFDILPLRRHLNPDPGGKPKLEPERFYPLGVYTLEDR